MDIKFLAEDNSQPSAVPRNHKAAFLVLFAVVVAGSSAIYFGFHHKDFAPAYRSQSSSAQTSLPLVSSMSSSRPADSLASSSAGGFRQSDDWQLLLVNGKIKIPNSFTPQIVNYDNVGMDQRIEPYFLQMKAAAAKDGVTLWLSGGYRSPEEQQKLYQQAVQDGITQGLSQSSAEQKAAKAVAKPGYSEHNTGFALDFNGSRSDFVSTDAYAWLQKHAAEYGFIMRYPQGKESVTGIAFQPWFYRYVGKDNARKMNAAKQCMEEFLKAP